jgi:carotenoid cleavage dioxygenase
LVVHTCDVFPQYLQIGDLKGFFGLFMVQMQELRKKLKVLDATYGIGTGTSLLHAITE